MSQSSLGRRGRRGDDRLDDEPTTLESEAAVGTVLDALDDAACLAILEATSDEVLTANEISERCELPLSTAYRKLDVLEDAGLIAERTRLSRAGKHASEYARLVDEVTISIGAEGAVEVRTVPRQQSESLTAGGVSAKP
jgi:DNA-binding transcriptional ArsR family regulator